MIYKDLYEIWVREKESHALQTLPEDFYRELADYVKKIISQTRMLDEKSEKSKLLRLELLNAQKMIKEIVEFRYGKIFADLLKGVAAREEAMTEEEKMFYNRVITIKEEFDSFLSEIVEGRYRIDLKFGEKRYLLIRFLRDVPAIVGSDMKTYGPFKTEDLATLPIENARILIKQGVAIGVEAE